MKYRDDFKIRFTKKPYFFVDNETKTVKCYLQGDVVTPNGLSGNRFMDNFRMFATGYAKCDKNDIFDVEIGKKIALARAESKLYWKVRTEVIAAKNDALKFITGANRFINKAKNVCKHNEDYIEKNFISVNKAKTQPRDNKGRFTSNTNKSKPSNTNESKPCTHKCANDTTTLSGDKVIKIKINRI